MLFGNKYQIIPYTDEDIYHFIWVMRSKTVWRRRAYHDTSWRDLNADALMLSGHDPRHDYKRKLLKIVPWSGPDLVGLVEVLWLCEYPEANHNSSINLRVHIHDRHYSLKLFRLALLESMRLIAKSDSGTRFSIASPISKTKENIEIENLGFVLMDTWKANECAGDTGEQRYYYEKSYHQMDSTD